MYTLYTSPSKVITHLSAVIFVTKVKTVVREHLTHTVNAGAQFFDRILVEAYEYLHLLRGVVNSHPHNTTTPNVQDQDFPPQFTP